MYQSLIKASKSTRFFQQMEIVKNVKRCKRQVSTLNHSLNGRYFLLQHRSFSNQWRSLGHSASQFTLPHRQRSKDCHLLSIPFSLFPIRNHSIFTKQQSIKHNIDQKPWKNDPFFMEDASPEEKEQWLKSMIMNDRLKQNENGKYEIDMNHNGTGTGTGIDSSAYLFVLKALSTSTINSAPQKCEEIMSKLERKFDAAREIYHDMNKNNNISYKFDTNTSIELAKEIVHDLKPTTECYNEVIRAWSNAKNPVIARAERWLDTLRRNRNFHNDNNNNNNQDIELLPPDAIATTETYNLFLKILSKGNAKKSQVLIDNATKAKSLLGEMITIHDEMEDERVQPNIESFNYVLRAITRCTTDPEITKKLMDTLRVMELLQRNADNPVNAVVKPNSITYALAIDSFGIAAYQKATSRTKRHKHKRNTKLLELHMKNDGHVMNDNDEDDDPYKEIAKGKSILKSMHDLHDAGNYDVVPDVVAYNTIITSYARISSETYNDAPMRAEGILREMIEMAEKKGLDQICPDTRTYNAVIRCWANSKESNAGVRSEWWLRRMSNGIELGGPAPDVNTYNSVMLAYHNTNQPQKAENLLNELIEMESESDLDIKPNSESFSIVIRSWLAHVRNTGHSEGCHNAYYWLSTLLEREEKDFNVTVSPELYYQIIKTAEISSRDTQDKALLNLALKTFSKLKSSRHNLDAMSYKRLLQIGIQTLSGPLNFKRRLKFIRTVISSCCDDGLLSKHLISVLRNQYMESNMGQDEIRVISQEFFHWPLPSNYSRNIKEENLLPAKLDFLLFEEGFFLL